MPRVTPAVSSRSQEWTAFLAGKHPGSPGGAPMSVGSLVFERDLKKILEESERFVMEDPEARDHIQGLLEAIGMEVPLEVAFEYAARRTAITGELPQDDLLKLHWFYEYVVWPVIKAQDAVMIILAAHSPSLSEFERALLSRMLLLARAFDRLFFAWRAKVVVPYQLGLRNDPGLKKAVSAACPNHYSVLVSADGQFVEEVLSVSMLPQLHEVSLVVGFPDEIEDIRGRFKFLLDRLNELISPPQLGRKELAEAVGYKEYFEAMLAAIVTEDLSTTEELWSRVDRAWLKIVPGLRVMPVHMMEDGYHHPTTVTPEFRVCWRSAELSGLITSLREAIAPFGAEAGDNEFEGKTKRIDADAFILMAGGLVDFRLAGQSVPNRPTVQREGMKVILDPSSMQSRQKRFEFLLRKCVGEKTLRWLEPHFSLIAHLLAVIGHELGHSWLINEESEPAFGTHKPSFEETKATLLGLMAMRGIEKTFKGKLGPAMAGFLLGEVLRRFTKNAAANQTFRPYYNEGKTIATCLMRAGILSIRDGKLELDASKCQNVDTLLACLDEPFIRLKKAYQTAFEGRGEEGLAQALAVVEEFAPDPLSSELAVFYDTVNANLEAPAK